MAAVGCSAGEDDPNGGNNNGAGASKGPGGPGIPGNPNVPLPGTGGTGAGERDVDCKIDPVTGEEICVCIKIVTWGKAGKYGCSDGQDGACRGVDALSDWLNKNSTGEATYFSDKPVITEESLKDIDVIILQDLNGWSFTADEKLTFQNWVEAGGGVISLAGYSGEGSEVLPTNDLLRFSGLYYVGTAGAGDTASNAQVESWTCNQCLGTTYPQKGWTSHPIGKDVSAVGSFWGRSVGGTGEVVAQEGSTVYGMTNVVGEGRVFLFHDEWVTYNSQWSGAGVSRDCRIIDQNDQCYDVHPTTTYQIPQFWYNSLMWSSGNPACFDIQDNTIVK